ncbi:hypothetical protein BAU15_01595 [Enterococcus sp. JM4C]|uniref:hypothetical protein n=1 Tax=Candidatus Enterococcus huntleyi TaxID=1857217 RepID=UPI00137B644E|nr:hypothetical protein [Enterococcus sp. JM4C]KAF1299367.1 hypothetical protein BAU15_01595 [Enterococcus sp. JM4C]
MKRLAKGLAILCLVTSQLSPTVWVSAAGWQTNPSANSSAEKVNVPLLCQRNVDATMPSSEVPTDEGFSDSKTSLIFEDSAELTLSVTKTGSRISTSVGDKVHVDVTLKKLVTGELSQHKSSMMIVPYPKEEQGFTITQPGVINFKSEYGEQRALTPLSGDDLQTILMFYAANSGLDFMTITGLATQTPEVGGSVGQSIFDNLVMAGDQITVSYESEITEAAIGKDSFTLSSGFYDSAGTGSFTGDLQINLPGNKITDWQLQLADDELAMTVDPQDNQTLIHAESGNWANYLGNKEATLAYQVDGGERQNVPTTDLNQTDKTFLTTFDLSTSDQSVTEESEHIVAFYLTIDGVTQEDSLLVHEQVKTNSSPRLTLNLTQLNLEMNDTGTYDLTLKGSWQDADSQLVTLSGNYADNTAIALTDNTFTNTKPGAETNFSINFTTAAGELKLGDNQLTFWLTDSEEGTSTVVEVTVTLSEKPNDAPSLKVDTTDIDLIRKETGEYAFTINGVWSDKDSSSIALRGEYVDKTSFTSESYLNNNKGQYTPFTLDVTVPVEKLNTTGSNQLNLVAIDKEGATSQVISLHFKQVVGTIQFDQVAEHSTFQAVKLANDEVVSHHNDDWLVTVSDTTNETSGPPLWRLEATQETPLENSNTHHRLSSTIEYKNSMGQVTPLVVGQPVAIDMKRGKIDGTKYNLDWSDTVGFQLPVGPSEPVGEYTTTIEWTIVQAP